MSEPDDYDPEEEQLQKEVEEYEKTQAPIPDDKELERLEKEAEDYENSSSENEDEEPELPEALNHIAHENEEYPFEYIRTIDEQANVMQITEEAAHDLAQGVLTIRGTSDPLFSAKLAEKIAIFYHIRTIVETGDIYYYDGTTYRKYGREFIRKIVKTILTEAYQESISGAVISNITAGKQMFFADFDKDDKNLIPVDNGVLKLDTLELLPYSPEYYFTFKLPVPYDSNAECPKWLKCIEQILPRQQDRDQLQEMFGDCLWRDYSSQAAWFLIGEGANGKGTILHILTRMLGASNCASRSHQELIEDRFASSDLYHKLANISGDIPSREIQNSDLFKKLTSGTDMISAQEKNIKSFQFINYAKLIYSMNEWPPSRDHTYAYMRRIMPLFFSERFGAGYNTEIKSIWENFIPELSGIFNWALEGLNRYQSNSEFSNRLPIDEVSTYVRILIDPEPTFVAERLITDDTTIDDITLKEDVFKAYKKFCAEKRLTSKTYDDFCRWMKHNGFSFDTTKTVTENGVLKRKRAWRGVRIAT